MRPPYSVLARRMGPGGAGALRGGARRNNPSIHVGRRAGRPKVVARRDYLNGGARMESYVLKRNLFQPAASRSLVRSSSSRSTLGITKKLHFR